MDRDLGDRHTAPQRRRHASESSEHPPPDRKAGMSSFRALSARASTSRTTRTAPPSPSGGPLTRAELLDLPDALGTVWVVLASPGHPCHYRGCTHRDVSAMCLRPCQEARGRF